MSLIVPMQYDKEKSTHGVREKIVEVIRTTGDESLMKLIGKAINGRDQECCQDRSIPQSCNHFLIIKRPPTQEREDKKDNYVSNLIGAYRKLETGHLLKRRKYENDRCPENGRKLVFEEMPQESSPSSMVRSASGRKSIRSMASKLRSPNFLFARSPEKPCT